MVVSDTIEKAALLQSLGVNVNLAPVCDVSNNPSDYIYPRTFGKDAKQTAAYVKTVVETMNGRKLGAVLKHFPGYGSNVDTHTGIATDTRPYTSFETADFLPFQAGIAAGAGGVLVSHNIVTCMDETLPASLSPAVHRVLRDTLGFNGVIMTDDLMMEAIKQYTGAQKAAVLAVRAGNDMVLAPISTCRFRRCWPLWRRGLSPWRKSMPPSPGSSCGKPGWALLFDRFTILFSTNPW